MKRGSDTEVTGDRLLAMLAALANPHRLRIIAALKAGGRNYVSQLAREIGISRPLLHLHLQKLEEAGLVTSLGFGHVSGLVALVHPQAFMATLDAEQRADYRRRADARLLAGQRRLASAIAGGPPLYERPADRRFDHEVSEKRQEAAMLLDANARLGDDDVYRQ